MAKESKDLLDRLNIARSVIGYTKVLIIALPLLLALVVSLVGMDIAYTNVNAATDGSIVDLARTNTVDKAVIDLERAAVADTVVVDLVRIDIAADAVVDLVRTNVDGNEAAGYASAATRDADIGLDR